MVHREKPNGLIENHCEFLLLPSRTHTHRHTLHCTDNAGKRGGGIGKNAPNTDSVDCVRVYLVHKSELFITFVVGCNALDSFLSVGCTVARVWVVFGKTLTMGTTYHAY